MSESQCAHSLAARAGAPVQVHWVATLADGNQVLIRPLRPEDREREAEFIRDLSPETRHFRFLCAIREVSSDLLDHLMEIDYRRKMAYIALVPRAGELIEIGISRYASSNDPTHCECAVTIADGWEDQGLDEILMGHLIDAARDNGFKRMFSIDAVANVRMRRLARAMGFISKRDPQDASQLIHSLDL